MSQRRPVTPASRPRVVLLADRPGWAFDHVARALTARLAHRFELRTVHAEVGCGIHDLEPAEIDLLYVFFWGERSHRRLGLAPERVVKEVASWRWALEERYGRIDAGTLASWHLDDCATVTTPSLALHETLAAVHPNVFHMPNGVDLGRFRAPPRRHRGLRIAWSGNPDDPCKGLRDVLAPACAGAFDLEPTDGRFTHAECAQLYARSDVLAIASEAESQPLPLLEALAAGCFPVTTDVGVVPELVVSGVNGLVVERTPEAFADAFAWCRDHLPAVRRAGRLNARLVAEERSWDALAPRFGALFDHVLGRGAAPERVHVPASGPARAALARGVVPLRVAFVTPEWAGSFALGGGLGRYLRRTSEALVHAGHAVEVFTTTDAAPDDSDPAGVTVHRSRNGLGRGWVRAALRALHLVGLARAAQPLLAAVEAFFLARALAKRERQAGFDLVQSSDYRAVGLFVPGRRRRGRPHLVRASNDEAELAARNGDDVRRRSWLDALQRRCLRRADAAYAPSEFLARHYAARHGIAMGVVRPPAFGDAAVGPPPERELPKRYFVHFGQLSAVKGTADLASALPAVWRRAPDFEMVWVGVDRQHQLPGWRVLWGEHRERVHWLGELPHEQLSAVVAAAEASVLPSRFDNLPNTAIESLALGVPVIGTEGSSLEELVVPGRDGELVPVGDTAALADAIATRWLAQPEAARGERPSLPAALAPAAAIEALISFAGLVVDDD